MTMTKQKELASLSASKAAPDTSAAPETVTLTVIRYGQDESLVETDAGFFVVASADIQNSVHPQTVSATIEMRPADDLGNLVDDVTFDFRQALRALHKYGITPASSREDVVRVLANFGKFSIKKGT